MTELADMAEEEFPVKHTIACKDKYGMKLKRLYTKASITQDFFDCFLSDSRIMTRSIVYFV